MRRETPQYSVHNRSWPQRLNFSVTAAPHRARRSGEYEGENRAASSVGARFYRSLFGPKAAHRNPIPHGTHWTRRRLADRRHAVLAAVRRCGGAVRCSPVRSNTFSISQFRVPPAGGGGDGDGGAALLLLLCLTVAQPYPITLSPPPTHPPSKCCGY